MNLQDQNAKLEMIQRITDVAELDAYEEGAKKRGVFPGEIAAVMNRRISLMGKKHRA